MSWRCWGVNRSAGDGEEVGLSEEEGDGSVGEEEESVGEEEETVGESGQVEPRDWGSKGQGDAVASHEKAKEAMGAGVIPCAVSSVELIELVVLVVFEESLVQAF